MVSMRLSLSVRLGLGGPCWLADGAIWNCWRWLMCLKMRLWLRWTRRLNVSRTLGWPFLLRWRRATRGCWAVCMLQLIGIDRRHCAYVISPPLGPFAHAVEAASGKRADA